MTIAFICGAIWISCSVLSYGIALHWYKREFPYFKYDFRWWMIDLLGPAALFGTLMTVDGKLGLDFKRYSSDERWEKFNERYNGGYACMTREEFDQEYP